MYIHSLFIVVNKTIGFTWKSYISQTAAVNSDMLEKKVSHSKFDIKAHKNGHWFLSNASKVSDTIIKKNKAYIPERSFFLITKGSLTS